MGFQTESTHVVHSTMNKKERKKPHTNAQFLDTRKKKQERGKNRHILDYFQEGPDFQIGTLKMSILDLEFCIHPNEI